MNTFSGFTPATLRFFRDLDHNNKREWFADQRPRYLRDVQQPARALAEELGPMVRELDPAVVVEPHRVVSRINRDTRFSHDKSPYRPRVFLVFRRNVERWSETPSFFFQVDQRQYLYGMGVYGAPAATMRRFREMIDADPEAFREMIDAVQRSRTLQLESDKYKRPFPHALPQNLAATIEPWYQSKSVAVLAYREPDKTLFSPKLADFLVDRFVPLKPLYDFLWKAVAYS